MTIYSGPGGKAVEFELRLLEDIALAFFVLGGVLSIGGALWGRAANRVVCVAMVCFYVVFIGQMAPAAYFMGKAATGNRPAVDMFMPSSLRGWVIIHSRCSHGEKMEVVNGRIQLQIPESGDKCIRWALELSRPDDRFFFMSQGKTIGIERYAKEVSIWREKYSVSYLGNGKTIEYSGVFIGTDEEWKRAFPFDEAVKKADGELHHRENKGSE